MFILKNRLLVKLANIVRSRLRKNRYQLFKKIISPKPEDTILDIGVGWRLEGARNFLELWYPYPEKIIALTKDDPHKFKTFKGCFPRVKLIFGDGRHLPFHDNSFDIVFSNATVEHVGQRRYQRKFIEEACRVGKKVFVATPNRWFPIDSHTLIPFAHWLPLKVSSWIYRKLGMKYFANVDNLNYLTYKKFLALFPKKVKVKIYLQRFFGIASNLIAAVEKLP